MCCTGRAVGADAVKSYIGKQLAARSKTITLGELSGKGLFVPKHTDGNLSNSELHGEFFFLPPRFVCRSTTTTALDTLR